MFISDIIYEFESILAPTSVEKQGLIGDLIILTYTHLQGQLILHNFLFLFWEMPYFNDDIPIYVVNRNKPASCDFD